MKKKLIVECDDREGDLTVVQELWNMGCDCEVKRLKVGDYVCGDVCVERKSIDDFCGSIMDGRLKRQADKMEVFEHKFVLISGRIGDRKASIHENCVLGAIAGLVFRGVGVICVDNDKQLAFIMKRLFERYKEKN